MICDCGKVRYMSKAEAKRSARGFTGARRGKVRVYRCQGSFWHLTSVSAESMAYLRKKTAGAR